MRARTLGPYRIERRLATGGMAEVFVAQRLGPHGFQKRVALKCILPQHARDPDFVAMFIDEARLAAQLEHPSIVQVFDFGEADGALFLAMEFVDGTNVNRLLRAVAANREVVPISAALHIAAEAARALAYAHHLCDESGKPLTIVHRDVSPANLLLTKRGHVKVADFGIARCAQSDHRTDDGHVRGKLGYMSPEQVSGLDIDGRSDVFTLGTVLAEMLIGEPLFGSGTDLDVLLRIRNADLGVLDRKGRAVPQDVRAVLCAALARHPDDRPEAGALAEALEDLMRRRGSAGRGARELARLLHRLDLVAKTPQDEAAHEPGARPTAYVDPNGGARTGATVETPLATRDMLGKLVLETPSAWEVRLADGHTLGPLTFPELVRRIVSGEVDDRALVKRDAGQLVPSGEVPELQRYLGSSALRWNPAEIRDADRRGLVMPGAVLSLVHRITSDRETGVLHLWDGQRRKKVYFVDGKPDFVASTVKKEMLGEYLVQRGVCLRMEVDMALALLPRYGGRLGDALVGLGVLRPVELYRAISGQVRERYLEIFRWRNGQWAFRAGVRSEEETFPLEQGAHELLRDAALAADTSEIEAALSDVRERVLSRESRPPAPPSAYGLPEPWLRLLDVRGDMTLGSIVARETASGGDVEDVYRAFYLGLSCRLVKAA
ncbi:serine/threonine protein kinase [Sandaracinus amylolyticus]|nr:serine/threonine-protein kinase [Sandaracinus amylolyticus]